MHLKNLILLLMSVWGTNGGVLLWSNQPLILSPLQEFSDSEFEMLVDNIDNPKIHIFKTPILRNDLKDIILGYNTAYTPNGYFDAQNATELKGDGSDKEEILSQMKEIDDTSVPFLYALVIDNEETHRRKREVTALDTDAEEDDKSVFYLGKSTKEESYGLLYASRNLILTFNNTNTSLGNTPRDMITVDKGKRDDVIKFSLNINIPQKVGKITLKFIFSWLNIISYWSLQAVIVTDTQTDLLSNLTPAQDIMIPQGFSYHCPGEAMFVNVNDSVTLIIGDMQVEVDSKRERFSDAWDCIPFTTAPIWSGLFVTALFIIVMFIGFGAMFDIKTMDRFDNYKTKQLHITTAE